MKDNDLSQKNIYLILTHGGDFGRTKDKVEDALGGVKLDGMIDFNASMGLKESYVLQKCRTILRKIF